ncbi:copper chaperone PCu(A)C [Porphyrobacter sp. YT40]|uniref:copper chaperone PCu(A)C n=1 Tax=Porphyrobacter sp. YT40 TaxID=2547601 RepID=UPI001141572D|nr:copper chaperone PCu(A)C [Porphyrobacter sp. YT40]QDH34876.1 copper chaperone PCu(A)C [Porphyrobacter sp. YT40]
MNTIRRAVVAIVLSAGAMALSGCSDAAEAPPAGETSAAAAGSLTVSNARVVMAPVAGNPAAVYFDLSYSGETPVTLTEVAVEGAGMTMIHDYAESAGKMEMTMAGDISLAKDAQVSFAPGGLHVMAMQPSDALKAGGTAKVTLTLSDGTTATVDAPVKAAGDER